MAPPSESTKNPNGAIGVDPEDWGTILNSDGGLGWARTFDSDSLRGSVGIRAPPHRPRRLGRLSCHRHCPRPSLGPCPAWDRDRLGALCHRDCDSDNSCRLARVDSDGPRKAPPGPTQPWRTSGSSTPSRTRMLRVARKVARDPPQCVEPGGGRFKLGGLGCGLDPAMATLQRLPGFARRSAT